METVGVPSLWSPRGGWPAKNELHNVYGRLTVLGRDHGKKEKFAGRVLSAFWICRCECGNHVSVRGGQLRSGKSLSCGCLRLDKTKERNSLPTGVGAMNRALSGMKANACRRKLMWTLTTEQAISMMRMDCHYCGQTPRHTCRGRNGDYVYTGLDRVDNSKGYEVGNVVPCCMVCNNAKRTLSLPDYLDWVKRVYHRSVLSRG